jgi:peptidoglycan/xylan/chitin deacetylase (PgdA/CDA1 family)
VLYHHIAEHDDEFTDRLAVRTHPDDFAWQLDTYARDYDVVDLETVLSGKLPRRSLLISFDDAYRSVLDVAAPMLAARDQPSVFFLTPGAITGTGLLLDNLLNVLANRVGMERLERAITGADSQHDDVPDLLREVVAEFPYDMRAVLANKLSAEFNLDLTELRSQANLYLDPDQVLELANYGIEIGNHTNSHVHCRRLDIAAADHEVAHSKRILQRMSGRDVRAFSHPYGDPASDICEQAIRDSGHQAEFLVYARANARSCQGPFWYRTSIHARDPKQLFIEIEVLPRLRALRHRIK